MPYRKIVLFLFIIPVVLGMIAMNRQFSGSSVLFYGFAENKETELSRDFDTRIIIMYAYPGKVIKKGDTLVVVERKDLKYKQMETTIEKKEADLKYTTQLLYTQNRHNALQNKIQNLEIENAANIAEIEVEKKRKES